MKTARNKLSNEEIKTLLKDIDVLILKAQSGAGSDYVQRELANRFKLACEILLNPTMTYLRYCYRPPTYSYDWDDFEEEVRQLFFRKISQIAADSVTYPKTYCSTMVINYYKSCKQKEKLECDLRVDPDPTAPEPPAMREIPSVDFMIDLDKALDSFPPRHKHPVIIAMLREGRSTGDIASELEIPERDVKRYKAQIVFFRSSYGYTNKEIASELGCCEKTVERYKQKIKRCFKCRGLIQYVEDKREWTIAI